MKTKLLLFSLPLLISFSVFSQTAISFAFNSVDIGRNLSLTGLKTFNRHAISVGIKYGINSFVHDNQNNVFKKRFFATTFMQHWGLVAGYQYAIKVDKPYLEPYFFYELQFTNSHTRNRMFLPAGYDSEGNVLYREYLEFFGPTIALENYIGVGSNIKLTEHFFITQKAGIGMINFQNIDPRQLGFKNNSTWEFGYMISFGIMYRLKEKKDE